MDPEIVPGELVPSPQLMVAPFAVPVNVATVTVSDWPSTKLMLPTPVADRTSCSSETFAVVVIGGLGSIRGAFFGAVIVGLMRVLSLTYFPEVEVMAIYLVVVAVLLVRPYGLFGRAWQ